MGSGSQRDVVRVVDVLVVGLAGVEIVLRIVFVDVVLVHGGIPLAVAELAPAVVAALVGGAAAAVLTVLALGPTLGLRVLTGGSGDPPPAIAPAVVLAVVGAALLLLALAVLAEAAAHRHDRLAAMLREGDAT